MSLSNEERTKYTVFAIKEIIEKADKLKNVYHHYQFSENIKKLVDLCNNIWPSFLGSYSDFLIGTPNNKVFIYNEDLWSIALCSKIPEIYKNKVENEDYSSPDEFNPLDYLNISSILKHINYEDIALVCDIYLLLSDIVYMVHRYRDEYAESKAKLVDLTCNIQGTCFSILSDSSEFARAYICKEIYKIIYGPFPYNEKYKDCIDKWLHEENIHHLIIAGAEKNINWLAEQHWLLLNSKDEELKKNRVLLSIRMIGRNFHHENEYKKLLEYLEKDKDFDDVKFKETLKNTFEECKKEYDLYNKQNSSRYNEKNDPRHLYQYILSP